MIGDTPDYERFREKGGSWHCERGQRIETRRGGAQEDERAREVGQSSSAEFLLTYMSRTLCDKRQLLKQGWSGESR